MDVGIITWKSYSKNCTMRRHGCRFHHMQENHIRSIKLWKIMDLKIIPWSYATKNQTMKWYGCWCYHMRIMYIHTKNQTMKSHGWRFHHMRIIYEGSNNDVSWISKLSHDNHILRRIKLWYVSIMDVVIITWKTYMKNQTIIRHCHVVIIAQAIWLM